MLWHCLVGHLVKPTDTFLTALRMSVVAFSFFPCFFVGLGFVVHNFLFADTAIRLLPAITSTISTSALLGAYIAMRVQKTATQLTCTIVLWIVAMSFTINLLSGPDYENKSIPLTLCFVAVMTQIKGLPFFAAWTIAQTLVDDWNRGHCNDQDMFLAIPGHYSGTGAIVRSVSGFGGTFLLGMCAWMYRKQVLETERRGEAAHAAVSMTVKLLKYHRRYDTTRMDKVLEHYERESIVDGDLISLFKHMKESMDIYKPFLPNYVLLQSGQRNTSSSSDVDDKELGEDDEGQIELDSEDGGGGERTDGVSHLSRSASYRGSSTGRRYKRGSRAGSSRLQLAHENHDDSNDVSDDSSSRGQRATRRRPGHYRSGSNASDLSAMSSNSQLAIAAAPSFNLRGPFFKGKISFGLLEIATRYVTAGSSSHQRVTSSNNHQDSTGAPGLHQGSSSTSTTPLSSQMMTQRLSKIVDTIYRIAKDTRASVHSFLGDRVQVSWNATHPIPMCESKAALFLLRVKEALLLMDSSGNTTTKDVVGGEGPVISAVAGAACTGTALVHTITTASNQAALLITMDNWLPLLETTFEIARKQQEDNRLEHNLAPGCILVDQATLKGASYDVHHCIAEAVRLSKKGLLQPGEIEPYQVYASPIESTSAFHHSSITAEQEPASLVSAVDPPSSASDAHPAATSSSTSLHLLHSLTSVKERSTHDEEWMYQVSAQESGAAHPSSTNNGVQLLFKPNLPHSPVVAASGDESSMTHLGNTPTGELLKEEEIRAAIRGCYMSALHSILEDGNRLMASAQLSQIEALLVQDVQSQRGLLLRDSSLLQRITAAGVDPGFFCSFFQRICLEKNTK